MYFKDYSRTSNEFDSLESEESRTIIIASPEINLKIPISILKNAGDLFISMIDGNFQESTLTSIPINNDLNLNESEWECYFDLVAKIKQIADIPMTNFMNLLLISDYLGNTNLFQQLRDFLDNKISTEPLSDYLNNWIEYFQIYTWISLEESGILSHFNARIKLHDKHNLLALLKCGQDLLNFIQECPQYLKELLIIFEIWWHHSNEALLTILGNEPADQIGLHEQARDIANSILLNPFDFDKYLKYTPIKYTWSDLYSNPNRDSKQDWESEWEPIELSEFTENNSLKFRVDECTIISQAEWHSRWTNLTCGLLDDINWQNLILAGGAIYKIMNPKITTFGPQTDLDLFLIGDEATQRAKLIELLNWFILKYTEDLYIGVNRSVVYLWVRGIPRNLQIISSKGNTALEILSQFDLSHAQMAYNGSNVLVTPGAIFSLNTRYSKQTKLSYIPSIYRVYKTLNGGYSLLVDRSRKQKYMKLSAIEKLNFQDRLFYNYFIPYSTTSLAKNCWEIKNHYKIFNVWVGEMIKLSEIINKIEIASDFRRGYDESEFSQKVISPLKIDWEQLKFKPIPGRYNRDTLLSISYDENNLIWNLPKMQISYINDNDEHDKKSKILVFLLSKLELELFENMDDKFIAKIRNFNPQPKQHAQYNGLVGYSQNHKMIFDDHGKFEHMPYNSDSATYFRVRVDDNTTFINAFSGEISKGLEKININDLIGLTVKIQGSFKYIWGHSSRNLYSLKLHPIKITYFPNSKQLKQILIQS